MAQLDILIARSDIEAFAQVSGLTKEEKQLHPYILAAQNVDIKKVLGNAFWTDLVNNRTSAKYKTVLEGGEYTVDGKTLTFSGLKAAIACYSYARYVMGKNAQDTPFGFMTKESNFGTPADRKLLSEISRDNIASGQYYLNEVVEFLKNDPDTYDLFDSCDSDNKRTTGVVRITPASKF